MKPLIVLCWLVIGVSGDPIVDGSLGKITGGIQSILDVDIETFRGIPYGKPPVGDRRFKLPEAFGPVGDFMATEYGPSCLQPIGPLAPKNRKLSEDCLSLNIFRKRGTTRDDKKAVIVTLHGGGFVAGSASDSLQNAVSLAGLGDVIIVSLNYRLGVLGFAHMREFAPGNLGLHDQRLALQWIQDHIEEFGGDPTQVTVMGVSAGSMSVAAHIMTPIDSRNLFRSAIMDAGVVASNGFHEDSESSYTRMKKIAAQLGCPVDSQEMVDCLRGVSAEALISFSMNTTGDNGISYFVATTDGVFIPRNVRSYVKENTDKLRKVRTIIGYAKDEGSFFVGTRFMAQDYPNPESRDEIFEYCKQLSHNYDYPLDLDSENIKKLVEDLYVNPHSGSAFQAIAAFQGDGIFKCAINEFIRSYSQQNDEVYVYQFERKLKATYAKNLNPDILGAFHLSPYLHFSGALFLMTNQTHPSDMEFTVNSMKMIADFAKSHDSITFRGLEWPSYSESERIMILDETPMLREGLPREQHCNELFSVPRDSRERKLKSEL